MNIWSPGSAPVSVIMITLNEGHNMVGVLENLKGWAKEVFVVDSYSKDDTVDIALTYGVNVVQRRFRDFGDQWNFAISKLPVKASWIMKIDPDELLSEELKNNIIKAIERNEADGITISRNLCFMGRELPIKQIIPRLWKSGKCKFSDVIVNEHPIIEGRILHVVGALYHYDSPNLEHWLEKQNRYTTAEAISKYKKMPLADKPRIFGSMLQRNMWLKKNFDQLPMRFLCLFIYYWIVKGLWRSGWVGYAWSHMRVDVMRIREYKYREMELTGKIPEIRIYGAGAADYRVQQYE